MRLIKVEWLTEVCAGRVWPQSKFGIMACALIAQQRVGDTTIKAQSLL